MSDPPPELNTGTLVAGGQLSPGTSMPKLESPFVDTDRTTDIPWYLLVVNLRKMAQPTGVTPGIYLGFTVNSYGQITDVTPNPVINNPTVNNPVINNPAISNGSWTNPTTNGGIFNSPTINTQTANGGTFASPTLNSATINAVTITGANSAPTQAVANNSTSIATTAYVKSQNYIPEAPIDGNRYCRQNGVWVAF